MAGGTQNANVLDYYPRTDTILTVIAGVNLVTPASYFAFKASPRPVLVKFVLFENFSVFPQGSVLPSTIAFTYGTDATFNNMLPAGSFSGQTPPFVSVQPTSSTPYAAAGQSVTFALTVGVAGSGTCQVSFVGAWL